MGRTHLRRGSRSALQPKPVGRNWEELRGWMGTLGGSWRDLAGSRLQKSGCPKAPVSPLELEWGMRRGGNRGLTFQEAVPDPFVLPPGVSLGHLLEGLDPFGTKGLNKRKKTNPKVSEKRLSAPGEGNHTTEDFVLGATMRIIFAVSLGVCACTEDRLSPDTQWRGSGSVGRLDKVPQISLNKEWLERPQTLHPEAFSR